jgi:hypothetical protein
MFLALSVPAADAAVYSLRAVKINAAPIDPPAGSVNAMPGDRIETEIFLAGWGDDFPGGLKVYQGTIDGYEGSRSGGRGTVMPCHWRGPRGNPISCIPMPGGCGQKACPQDFPTCSAATHEACEGTCVAGDENADHCAFITLNRDDFIFADRSKIDAINLTSLTTRYFALATSTIVDPGVPRYCGSMVLKISPNACGTFTIGFIGEETFIGDENAPPRVAYPSLESLTIVLPECPPMLMSSDPGHCTIDTRRPHAPTATVPLETTNRLVMSFDRSTAGMTFEDFDVTTMPDTCNIRRVQQALVGQPAANDVTVVLNQRIEPECWTCVRHIESERQSCLASLPGDMNWSRLVSNSDIEALTYNLDGLIFPVLPPERCDMDRNGRCLPSDVLMGVDVMTGAWSYSAALNTELPECPPFKP